MQDLHCSAPLKAFWDILVKSTSANSLELALSIIHRCIERCVNEADWIESVKPINICYGDSPLALAVISHRNDVVSELIKAGANVNARNYFNDTPLHAAASVGNSVAVRLLINVAHGADLMHSTNGCGWTPLHYTALCGHLESFQLLVDAGSDIMKRETKDGYTPLHLAVEAGHYQVAAKLIDIGASLSSLDNNYRTPLHIAALNKHLNCVQLLIISGADIHAVDKRKKTPAQLSAASQIRRPNRPPGECLCALLAEECRTDLVSYIAFVL